MAEPLWTPDPKKAKSSRMSKFIRKAKEKGFVAGETYEDLRAWSVDRIEEFWPFLWEEMGVIASKKWDRVLEARKMPGAKWFEGARLNFAENLLRFRDGRKALVALDEKGRVRTTTYRELFGLVARCAAALKAAGVRPGDRVAGFVPNVPESVVAMLGAASLGAVWSSCSPDFGIQGVLDRFGQIEPKVLFTADGYFYNGKAFDSVGRIAELLPKLPSVEQVVVIPFVSEAPDLGKLAKPAALWPDFLRLSDPEDPPLEFPPFPFDHPLYILYTSGTTGVPKCMVHGAGGTLLQHLKELVLHTGLERKDTILYFTTCGWMMWNWLVSSLAVGSTVFLYDGSPTHPDAHVLWKAAEEHGITVFGTSARYLAAVQQAGLRPGVEHDLSKVRAVLSTGSPLSPDQFRWVYEAVKKDVLLASIAGGGDIISCFMLGNPVLPVYAGEIQCRGLGMDVQVWDDAGRPVTGEQGELVCAKPAPSMPIAFWNDPDGSKYFKAYFDHFPGVWRHGDFSVLTEHGGIVMFGRSDATLKPGGVRIGTSEIYRSVETVPEIADSLVIGRDRGEGDEILLFVVLKAGKALDEALLKRIKDAIRTQNSPRHVPREIHQVKDVPYTISGKKVELAVKNLLTGREVKNRDALKNPEALDEYRRFA